ncbi:transformer-2 protein [Marchantia polymorpha subsp. ruderalis]|uniref:Uncharacterized protein n=2 Tax=Marchantia polymorpha TaxID=3197 RepID=A0AAF6B9W9_MARPO|nr:hypothetical protein MARPO_0070s0021 [Marchantia polymorpha]BBN08803.1 hypothetical protein Mp_4g14600 [Marchantia polymorpha subsp. ruderalis]|eukprot:PTQ35549.1 hypothetical protein MARPO_0070s0021 [Marchantia polymorpha]
MNLAAGASPLLHSGIRLPRLRVDASDGFLLGARSRRGLSEAENDIMELEDELVVDPDMFEEVFPTVRRETPKTAKPGRSANRILEESSTKSILIPEEWVPVQKYHQRTKKEKKQESLALTIQRAREKEAEDRAIREEAAREVRARLFGSVYLNEEVSSRFVGREQEGNESADDDGVGRNAEAKDSSEESESEAEAIIADFRAEEAQRVSGRARPRDYRSGLEFSSLEEVAERLREVPETSASSSSSSEEGSNGSVVDDEPLIVRLSAEEKALLKNRNLNFATISSKSWSPLHTLAAAGQVYLAAEIIKRGVQVDAVDKEGFTPLHRAIQSGRKMIVRLLLKAGANPHVRDKDGATLLHYAAQTGSHEIAKLLLRDDIDVNAADNDGWTPLHVAVQSGRTELIRCLVNRGADMNQANNDGNSPLDLSLSFGNCFRFYDTIKFMKRKEAQSQLRRKVRDNEGFDN